MLELEGPLQRAVLSRTLWLVLVGPLLGALWQIFIARPRLERATGRSQRRALAAARRAALTGILAAGALLASHVILLFRLPAGRRAFYDHVLPGVRMNGLEAPLDLWLDPRGAALAGLACVVVGAAAVHLARARSFEGTWTRWTWLQLTLVGLLLAVLGDGMVTVASGWALTWTGVAWLAGWTDPRPGVAAASWGSLAVAAVLLGGGLLFWGLGGGWDADAYLKGEQDRYAVARAAAGQPDTTLSMATPPGALLYLDGARAPTVRAPFTDFPLPPGSHVVRVDDGIGTGPATSRFVAVSGDSVQLVRVGPTMLLHAMREQLALRDASGGLPVRRALEERMLPGGVAVVPGALLAWIVAVLALATAHVPLDVPRRLSAVAYGATSAVLGPSLLVRIDFLFPSAYRTGVLLGMLGAAVVLTATWRSLAYFGAERLLTFLSTAPVGVGVATIGLAGADRALGAVAVVGLGAAGYRLATATRLPSERAESPRDLDEPLLVGLAAQVGELLASMERHVVGAVTDALAGGTRIVAWVLATADEHVVAAPADLAAAGARRAADGATVWTGLSVAVIAWALLAGLGAAILLHALGPWG